MSVLNGLEGLASVAASLRASAEGVRPLRSAAALSAPAASSASTAAALLESTAWWSGERPLASACATGLAQGLPLIEAVARGWNYVHEAMLRAPGFGAGHGPLDHGWPVRE